MHAAQEVIIITRNGTEIAKLTSVKDASATNIPTIKEQVREKATEYSTDGKKATLEEFSSSYL